MPHNVCAALACAVLLIPAICFGQVDSMPRYGIEIPTFEEAPHLWRTLGDSMVYFLVIRPGDTLKAWELSEAYRYSVDGSSCTAEYSVSHLRVNDTPISPRHWRNHQVLNADAGELHDQSVSDTFSVSEGDTISFYREFSWIDSYDGTSYATTYWLDTLSLSVELCDAGSNSRAALLDSISAWPATDSSGPVLSTLGPHPIMATVSWVVPEGWRNRLVCVRHRLDGGDDQPHTITRHDEPAGRTYLSWKTFSELLSEFGSTPERITESPSPSVTEGIALDVEVLGGKAVRIRYGAHSDRLAVGVYNAAGDRFMVPVMAAEVLGQSAALVQLTHPGSYYAVLTIDGAIASVRKFVVE